MSHEAMRQTRILWPMRLGLPRLLLAAFSIGQCTAQFQAQRIAPPPLIVAPHDGLAGFTAISAEGTLRFLSDRVLFRTGLDFEIRYLGSNPNVTLEGIEVQAAPVNFIIGTQSERWLTNRPTYRKVIYREVYSGIDAEFSFRGSSLKSEFVVAPGSDPQAVRFRYVGLESPKIDERGGLRCSSKQGGLREEAPVAYQWKQGKRVDVAAAFAVADDGTVHFDLGAFDTTLPLVIDPTISYSSFLGAPNDTAAT